MADKKDIVVLDACCGSRMFWEEKEHPNIMFMDNRRIDCELCDGRRLVIDPDILADFREIPLPDESVFYVVFDPPHLLNVGRNSWMAKKYGMLNKETWRDDIVRGFRECWRVLASPGVLDFKWSQKDIRWCELAKLLPMKRTLGDDPRGKNTIWSKFIKFPSKTRDGVK